MHLVASAPVVEQRTGRVRTLDLYVGDVTDTSVAGPVELFCQSAFPNDYVPVRRTIVGQLVDRGIDVAALAAHPSLDQRASNQTWVSAPLDAAKHGIGRLICFEHQGAGEAPTLVGNLFRTVREVVLSAGGRAAQEVAVLRTPLLATGNQGVPAAAILEQLIRQAYLSLSSGLPVDRVQVVLSPRQHDLHALLVLAGQVLERERVAWHQQLLKDAVASEWDFFVSYRHQDRPVLDPFLGALRSRSGAVRLYVDREQLEAGGYWKRDLVHGLYRSRRALCFVTDGYPDSGNCMDEFHAALCLNLVQPGYLVPVLGATTRRIEDMPRTIQDVHHLDPRPYVGGREVEFADMLLERLA